MSLTYDKMATTTLKNYRGQMVDNIFNEIVLLHHLKAMGMVKVEPGGLKFLEHVQYAKNTNAGSYDGFDTLSTAEQDPFTLAEYDAEQISVTIPVSGIQKAKNRGKYAVLNLLEELTKNAEMSLKDELNTELFSDGTGNSNKDIDGLGLYLAATQTSGTVGGIDRSTYSWWRAQTATVSSFKSNRSSSVISDERKAMINMRNACARGSTSSSYPDLIITDQNNYEYYERDIMPDERFAPVKEVDIGFEALKFKSAIVAWDAACTATLMYFINSRHMKFRILAEGNFRVDPFITPTNQDASVGKIVLYANLTVDSLRDHGVLTVSAE
jgi:hypothetical protein